MRVIIISFNGFGVTELKNVTNIAWSDNTVTISYRWGTYTASTLTNVVQIIP